MRKGFSLEVATEYCPAYNPEKLLFLAILERAFRDLFPHIDSLYRRNAIGWFNCTNPGKKSLYRKPLISFNLVIETLELTSAQVDYLKTFVKEAEEYEHELTRQKQNRPHVEEKREESGEGVGEFIEGKWSTIGEEISASIWDRGSRCGGRRVISLSSRGERR